ncbi:MAG: TIGR02757 family protein [Chitinophagaceae bacterium]|nr:TIGR02757 family protein [Chitinophagaceae bacterium]MBK8953837.1 TIGR02757 family protein [Chitinophagaceae bacterium]
MIKERELKLFLDKKVDEYNQPSFITNDPVSIPRCFTKKKDIEIAGFFAALFAWGNRTTIINKSKELMGLMGNAPYNFCLNADTGKLKQLALFKHRTFNADDLYYFIEFFRQHYSKHSSLEAAFFPKRGMTAEEGLDYFKSYFFSYEHLKRTEKHISSPAQKSACKRLNMYLRWMVRKDNKGVDFGIWSKITPAQLVCPLDVHVARVARKLGLLNRKQNDWQAAEELTEYLRTLDKNDPVKYDFALFSLGVVQKY